MLNLKLGSAEKSVDGRACILTRKGESGHALYGPYQQLVPGHYIAGFSIEAGEPLRFWRDAVLAVIDVSADSGKKLLARVEVRSSDVRAGPRSFAVPFTVEKSCRAEYRVWVNGKASLRITDNLPAVPLTDADALDTRAIDLQFPVEAGRAVPFFVEHEDALRSLFDRGVIVRIVDNAVQLVVNGITLHARSVDDIRFVGEMFFENAYNFRLARPVVVFDVGMNLGLASLHFASKPFVAAVHSFEPFPETFDRALANIALNPDLASKIKPVLAGLSDYDYKGAIVVDDRGDSGAMTTLGVTQGVEIDVALRDAGPSLAPLIEEALAQDLEVILKVDCEGSEFAVFASLERSGLLGKIRAFLVEWHTMLDDKDQETLIAPLEAAGYLIIDRSPPVGNGFFYAVRIE